MISQKVKEIIANVLQINADEIKEDQAIQKDLGADSLDVVDIVMNIEDSFNIQVSDESLEKIVTVGDVITEVEKVVG